MKNEMLRDRTAKQDGIRSITQSALQRKFPRDFSVGPVSGCGFAQAFSRKTRLVELS